MGDPYITYKVVERHLKEEDAYVAEGPSPNRSFSVFCVFDGHAGADAPVYCRENIVRLLQERLPKQPAPSPSNRDQLTRYAEQVRLGLLQTFLKLNQDIINMEGTASGTTAVVAVATGKLLSVATAGDSDAYLDTGAHVIPVSNTFRLGVSVREIKRLEAAGAHVARLKFDLSGPVTNEATEKGCGPIRVWPGGLMMSRTIGDNDSGEIILPHPHVKQFVLPKEGCRLALGSDGIWDQVSGAYALPRMRSNSVSSAGEKLMSLALKYIHPTDDMTAIVVDFLSGEGQSFKEVASSNSSSSGSSGGFFSCCTKPDVKMDPSMHPEALDMLFDDDMYYAASEYQELYRQQYRQGRQQRGRQEGQQGGQVTPTRSPGSMEDCLVIPITGQRDAGEDKE